MKTNKKAMEILDWKNVKIISLELPQFHTQKKLTCFNIPVMSFLHLIYSTIYSQAFDPNLYSMDWNNSTLYVY